MRCGARVRSSLLRLHAASRSNQRSDMQESPASILRDLGHRQRQHFQVRALTSMSCVRGHPALMNTTSFTRSALVALRSSSGTTRIRNPSRTPDFASSSVASKVSSSISEQSVLRCKRAARNLHDLARQADGIEQLLQISGAGLVRSRGEANENAVGRDENVAAVGEAIAQMQDFGKSRRERRGQLLCFRHAAGRSGPQQQRRLAEHQRGILDKDRIRKLLERVEHGYLDAGCSQCGDVGLVLGQNGFENGRWPRNGAQTVDDTFPGRADDGGIEIENAHGSFQRDSSRLCKPGAIP